MNYSTIKPKLLAASLALTLGSVSTIHATIYTFDNRNTTTASDIHWTLSGNWATGTIANSEDAWVQFGSEARFDDTTTAADRLQINFNSSNIPEPIISVAAFSFFEGFNPASNEFYVRNNQTNTEGTIRLYGQQTTIGGEEMTLLIENHTTNTQIFFNNANSSFNLELRNSGVIYGAADTLTVIRNTITEADGSHGIIKRGEGTLYLQSNTQASSVDTSTYSGGFTLEEGTVVWNSNGGPNASPFGSHNNGSRLTLRGGTLRSNNDSSRNINVGVILDGGSAFGSTNSSENGAINVNSNNGIMETIMTSDSTLTIHNTTSWFQEINGSGYTLTRDGSGTFRIRGQNNSFDLLHLMDGTTTIESSFSGERSSIMGDVLVDSGATFRPNGDVLGTTTVAAGGILSPRRVTTETNAYFGTDHLVMEAGSQLSILFDSYDFANIVVDSFFMSHTVDGAHLSVTLDFQPVLDDVFVIIENLGSTNIAGLFVYNGQILQDGDMFLVSNGDYSQYFQIDYDHDGSGFGNSIALVAVVPEPSTWALLSGMLALLFTFLVRRRRSAE